MAADSPSAFSSNSASFAQRQVTQEQLRATQEELATKIRELQIYESNYIQLKKDLARWKKKFEFIFRENELLSLETTKLDASHKQIAFLQQEIKFKEEESEALRGLVSALEASNKKARASRLDSAARLANRRDLPATAAAGAAVLDESTAVVPNGVDARPLAEQLERERNERSIEKERFESEVQALKAENNMLLKDLDHREAAQQLSDEKVLAHKERIASLERSLKDEQDSHMAQLREKQDLISELETQIQQMQRRRRSSAVSREEADAPGFGPAALLVRTKLIDEEAVDGDEPEEPDTPPGTPPPISAGALLPPSDPLADQILKDWEDDKKIRPAKSTQFDWHSIDAFIAKLPYEAKDGAERILRQALDPDQFPEIAESQLLVRALPQELKKELQDFVVPLLKAHSHLRVTYSTLSRRTIVADIRLTLEPRENEFTGGLALGEKRFGRDHMFYGPSHDDVTRLVLHTARYLTHEKKAIYISKSKEKHKSREDHTTSHTSQSIATTVGSEPEGMPPTPTEGGGDAPLDDGASANGAASEKSEEAGSTGSGDKPKGSGSGGKKWPALGLNKTKKLMGKMGAAALQRVARLNQVKHVHEGTTCQLCQTSPIVGARYSCATCVGFDMCESCYSLGGHGLENSDELFYRVQELVLAKCPRLVEELDLLELLRFEICRSNLRKFSFCLNWLADIVNGKSSQQLQARALEIPGIRRDIRKLFVPLLIRVCSNREDLEVKTEWELESDNSAEVHSVTSNGAGGRASVSEGDGRFLETLRIWVADQYRTTSPFVERSLLKFREGMAVEGDSDEEEADQFEYAEDETPSRRRAATAAARLTDNGEERSATTRRGTTADRSHMVSQEF